MIRVEFNSMKPVMALYQAALAGKFESRDKSLLLNEALNLSIQSLLDEILRDARAQQNENLANAMLDGLILTQDYPQYQMIVDAFSQHADEVNWASLSEQSQKQYLSTACFPLEANDSMLNHLIEDINNHA